MQGGHLKHLVEFPLEGGGSVVVELDEAELTGTVRAARPGEIVAKANQTFEEALDRVKPAASILITKLRDLVESPDEIEVEFGLKLHADAGAFVASAGGEAHYKITLKWKSGEK